MLFPSFEFLFLFLPITFFVYAFLSKYKWFTGAKVTLILASIVFYAYWDYRYLLLIFFSIGFNYIVGKKLKDNPNKKLLTFGVAMNLGLLTYFKYVDFFLENVNWLTGASIPLLNVALPLAISFFTFQQIGFLVDAYKGRVADFRFTNYVLFVVFFPQLIAGPIVQHKDVIPQFKRKETFQINYKNLTIGLFVFAAGLFKKVVIADSVALWATPGFDEATSLTFYEAWGSALAYTFQLYFDFSGYSEMALGLGLMFNIKLPINFNSPYKANSIIDFWRSWHMTLSNFLKDYLYIPLGGNRSGKLRKYRNLFLTMLLGGIWHGAGWTFVIWGTLHGLYNVINHSFRDIKKRLQLKTGAMETAATQIPEIKSFISIQAVFTNAVARILTFIAVIIGWVFFRAETISDALKVLKGMIGLNGAPFGTLDYLPQGSLELTVLLGLFLWVNFAPNTIEFSQRLKPNWNWALLISLLLITAILFINRKAEFLYFQF
ncbi:MBOAT family O-acyltransferase [Pueribacillus sp. YX66]|uniref:MBOAT family O-acyltransferase n=1 Tax=Pueribacillus sp. YX66 TaxID=3229242 RepID=UPI00358D5D18